MKAISEWQQNKVTTCKECVFCISKHRLSLSYRIYLFIHKDKSYCSHLAYYNSYRKTNDPCEYYVDKNQEAKKLFFDMLESERKTNNKTQYLLKN
jgi:hypothetical protein